MKWILILICSNVYAQSSNSGSETQSQTTQSQFGGISQMSGEKPAPSFTLNDLINYNSFGTSIRAMQRGSQVFTGTPQFRGGFKVVTGTVTIQTSNIFIETSTVFNLQFSTSGTFTFTPNIHNSTSTVFPANNTSFTGTNTSFSACISTLTLQSPMSAGSALKVIPNLTLVNSGAGNCDYVAVLVDGKYPPGFNFSSALVGMGIMCQAANDEATITPIITIQGLSAGIHSVCLQIATTAGTWTLRGADSQGSWSIEELK